MDEKALLVMLELPRETHVLRTFPYNRIAPRLTAGDKKLFQGAVDAHGVRLLATISPKTTNIPVYEEEDVTFQEVHFFQIKLKNLKVAKRIYKIIAEAMPYPLFIRFVAQDEIQWIGATHQKIEKTGLLKMNTYYLTNPDIKEQQYLQCWAFTDSDTYHLKAFYEGLLQQMVQVELENTYKSSFNQELHADTNRLEKIKSLDKEIASYISKAKKETQMNKRIELQMKANELKNKREQYLKEEK